MEMALETLVFRLVVCAVVHEEYVMARFWMRDEAGVSYLREMCSLDTMKSVKG